MRAHPTFTAGTRFRVEHRALGERSPWRVQRDGIASWCEALKFFSHVLSVARSRQREARQGAWRIVAVDFSALDQKVTHVREVRRAYVAWLRARQELVIVEGDDRAGLIEAMRGAMAEETAEVMA